MVTIHFYLSCFYYYFQGVQGGKGEQGPAGPPGFQVSQLKLQNIAFGQIIQL